MQDDEVIPKVKRITPQSKASSQDRLIRHYAKYSRKRLGLSKTRLAHFMKLTNNICKRDLFLVLRKIKFNESFDVLGAKFSMRASTAFYIFKRRIRQIAGRLAPLIDWHGDEMYVVNNPKEICCHVQSMVDHFVIDRKRKFLISCSPFGFINFLSCGFPVNMANRKIVKQSKFVRRLPKDVVVMGPEKYQFLAGMLRGESYFKLWVTFEQVLFVNMHRMKRLNKWAGQPMIIQVKNELRRFKILSDPHLDSKLLPIIDNVMVICAGLCNLRKNWRRFCKLPCDVDQECYQDRREEPAEVEEENGFDRNNNQTKGTRDKDLRSFFISF